MNVQFYKGALEKMVLIRETEQFIAKEFFDQKIFSFLHLMIGMEASPVGVCCSLDKDDICLGNHRSHGHYLAKGGDLSKLIYEVFGDQRGCCKGFGGSMHMLDRSVNFNGSTPILGSIPAIAVGQSFAAKLKGLNIATVVFLGDGAAEEGIFMESINLAANKECPIIFVIEDNKYSVNSSHLDRKSIHYSHKSLIEGLGAKYLRSNGQNFFNVYESAKELHNFVKSNQRPAVLHLDVLRRHAHSGPIFEHKDAEYRKEDTIEHREKMDPIKFMLSQSKDFKLSDSEINLFLKEVQEDIREKLSILKESINARQI